MTTPAIACRRLPDAPWHHFFGYYNKTVWHRGGRYLLANRTPVKDAVLTPEPVSYTHLDVYKRQACSS